jgi:hypothetical protein
MEGKKPSFKVPALNTAKVAEAQERERKEAEQTESSAQASVPTTAAGTE